MPYRYKSPLTFDNSRALIGRGLQDMKVDDPQRFVFRILGLGGWIIRVELYRKIVCMYHTQSILFSYSSRRPFSLHHSCDF